MSKRWILALAIFAWTTQAMARSALEDECVNDIQSSLQTPSTFKLLAITSSDPKHTDPEYDKYRLDNLEKFLSTNKSYDQEIGMLGDAESRLNGNKGLFATAGHNFTSDEEARSYIKSLEEKYAQGAGFLSDDKIETVQSISICFDAQNVYGAVLRASGKCWVAKSPGAAGLIASYGVIDPTQSCSRQ